MNNNDKLPVKRELFLFIFLNVIHVVSYLFIFSNLKFCFLILLEFLYFFYLKISVLKLVRTLYFTFIIFILNLLFFEGELIFKLGFLKITKEGIVNAFEKSIFLAALLFTTGNVLKNNKEKIIYKLESVNKNSMIIKSINYFFTFIEKITFEKNIKNVIKKIFLIYEEKEQNIKTDLHNEKIGIDFYIYHLMFFTALAALFFIKT